MRKEDSKQTSFHDAEEGMGATQEKLENLLSALFTIDELFRFLCRYRPQGRSLGRELVNSVPSPHGISKNDYFFQAAAAMVRRGLVDHHLRTCLEKERPGQRRLIAAALSWERCDRLSSASGFRRLSGPIVAGLLLLSVFYASGAVWAAAALLDLLDDHRKSPSGIGSTDLLIGIGRNDFSLGAVAGGIPAEQEDARLTGIDGESAKAQTGLCEPAVSGLQHSGSGSAKSVGPESGLPKAQKRPRATVAGGVVERRSQQGQPRAQEDTAFPDWGGPALSGSASGMGGKYGENNLPESAPEAILRSSDGSSMTVSWFESQLNSRPSRNGAVVTVPWMGPPGFVRVEFSGASHALVFEPGIQMWTCRVQDDRPQCTVDVRRLTMPE